MAPEKRPSNFLRLSRELRQKIILQTYHATKASWVYRNHNSDIEDWVRKLYLAVERVEIKQDIEKVKGIWMAALDAKRQEHEEAFEDIWA